MACYVLRINNCGKLQERYNEGVDWMFPQFWAIKGNSVYFSINKILQGCVVMVDVFKRSDAVGTPIRCGSANYMVLNTTLDVLSIITRGGWNFRGKNCILLYLNFFNHCLYAGRALQGARDIMAMIYPPNISAFVDKKQIVTNFASVIFSTQVKSLKHDGNLYKFRNVLLSFLLKHNKYL